MDKDHSINQDGKGVRLSASLDGILDVTPVSSYENEGEKLDRNDNAEGQGNRVATSRNDDAFSSSSEEENRTRSPEILTSSSSDSEGYNQSEWDKAMMAGKASTGRASDFFARRSNSADSSELLPQTEQEILQPVDQPTTPPPSSSVGSVVSGRPSVNTMATASSTAVSTTGNSMHPIPGDDHLSAGVLPDVFLTMRQQIESLTLFDSDMMRLAVDQTDDDPMGQESRESLKRSSQQSISAAVLVSLAHKRYERRRLAAMEIEKVVRSLVSQNELDRVRAILLLLSDDYVRSTSEDARKGGVVALAACAIGLKKAQDNDATTECRDLILASVVHACQDHSQRVRYYATESLFNVVKVIPSLAIQHFFILFEILRSLYADVDSDVRSGADLLDKKLKEVIISAINLGTFTVDACVPVFARFVHMRNKATKLLTLTWLQELNEKLIGAPILEFLHLFLGGIYDMVADPTVAVRQSALAFLQSVLPKLLVVNSDGIDGVDDGGIKVDFDKILQSLVTTMEHPDPFVRKVAIYWMSRIVKAHMVPDELEAISEESSTMRENKKRASAASVSVRNSVPHVLPGILLSISDSYNANAGSKESFLPDQSTRALAEQTNMFLQDAVRRDGSMYIQHLDAFIVALREELDSPGGNLAPAVERSPYRLDVKQDGTGIETTGWFRASTDTKDRNDEAMVMSRLCALDWVTVLYEVVVPTVLKADYAREFISAIIHQLVDNPPKTIVQKSLEVLAKITVPAAGEEHSRSLSLSGIAGPLWASSDLNDLEDTAEFPMTPGNVEYALDLLEPARRRLKSRDRQVFSALIQLYSSNEHLLVNLSDVLTLMCKLQPPEFVFLSFSVELDRFIRRQQKKSKVQRKVTEMSTSKDNNDSVLTLLSFVSSFVQHMSHVLLHAKEARELRDVLKDCMRTKATTEEERQACRMFHVLLHSFAHNVAATVSLCLWSGAYRTASQFLNHINPLEIHLIFLLEIDKVVEMLERPFFRHLHVRMLERDKDAASEGSGTMLFKLLKSLLMILPQSTCYNILKDRLVSVSRFRQSTMSGHVRKVEVYRPFAGETTKRFVDRIEQVRSLHCMAKWQSIRADSLEVPQLQRQVVHDEGADRRQWLGYVSQEEEEQAQRKYREEKNRRQNNFSIEEVKDSYHDLEAVGESVEKVKSYALNREAKEVLGENVIGETGEKDAKEADTEDWKSYWESADPR